MLPEVFHVPYPMAYHGVKVEDSLDAIERLFKADVDPARVAAIILEPVLGEGGVLCRAGRAAAQAARAVRSARHRAHRGRDSVGVRAHREDVCDRACRRRAGPRSPFAKSVAGGVPLSAVIGKAEIMDAPGPGGLGGTYAGSPLGCAAGLVVLDVIRDEKLLERASQTGNFLVSRLRGCRRGFRPLGMCGGWGPWWRSSWCGTGRRSRRMRDLTKAVVQAAAKRGAGGSGVRPEWERSCGFWRR